MVRRAVVIVLVVLAGAGLASAQVLSRPKTQPLSGEVPKASRYFAYVDREVIWTIENSEGQPPILNIVTFSDTIAPLRCSQIRIYDPTGKRLEVKELKIETGDPKDPYRTKNLRVLGHSFIGLVVDMKDTGFEEASRLEIEWNGRVYELVPLNSLDFNILAGKIDNININSPDIRDDFRVLQLEPLGKSYPATRRGG